MHHNPDTASEHVCPWLKLGRNLGAVAYCHHSCYRCHTLLYEGEF